MSDTSEIAEVFKELRLANKAKKEDNRKSSTETLVEKGIKFDSKNWGNHLIVEGKAGLIDYWPSTGKFIARSGKTGRGILNLLKLCKGDGR